MFIDNILKYNVYKIFLFQLHLEYFSIFEKNLGINSKSK